MMNWYGGAAGWAMMAVTSLLGLLLIAVVVWAVVRIIPATRTDAPHTTRGGPDVVSAGSAQDILDRRLAAGEIDIEQYRATVRELSTVRPKR